MVKHLYGEFSDNQIKDTKKSIRGSIFFLLLCVDPDTSESYEDVDVNKAFDNLLYKIDGLNELFVFLYDLNLLQPLYLFFSSSCLFFRSFFFAFL